MPKQVFFKLIRLPFVNKQEAKINFSRNTACNMLVSNTNIFLNIFEIFCGLQPYFVKNDNIQLSKSRSVFSLLHFISFTAHITIYYGYKHSEDYILTSAVLHALQYYYLIFLVFSLLIIYIFNFINYRRINALEIQVSDIEIELDCFNTNPNLREIGCI